MIRLKSAKIYFFFAVLLFVAKPFIGFSVLNRMHPLTTPSILVKAFTKRKLEYVENSSFDIHTIQKKLADPVRQCILRFSFLLSIIFSAVFVIGVAITDLFLRRIQLNLSPQQHTYLHNGQLII